MRIDDPDEICVAAGRAHAIYKLPRVRWPLYHLIPRVWRYTWRCLYCGESAR